MISMLFRDPLFEGLYPVSSSKGGIVPLSSSLNKSPSRSVNLRNEHADSVKRQKRQGLVVEVGEGSWGAVMWAMLKVRRFSFSAHNRG
jgi:hypothetical protein